MIQIYWTIHKLERLTASCDAAEFAFTWGYGLRGSVGCQHSGLVCLQLYQEQKCGTKKIWAAAAHPSPATLPLSNLWAPRLNCAQMEAFQGHMLVNILAFASSTSVTPSLTMSYISKVANTTLTACCCIFFFLSSVSKNWVWTDCSPSFAWKGPGVIIAEEIPEQVLKGIYFHAPI